MNFALQGLNSEDRLVHIPDEYAIRFCPNAEFERIWRPIVDNLHYFLFGCIALFAGLAYFNWLDPLMLGLARAFLLPLKPLLQGPPNPAVGTMIDWVGRVSFWVYGIAGVFVACFAVQRSEQPTHIGLTKDGLLLTQYRANVHRYWILQSIPWNEIESVSVERPTSTKSANDYKINITSKGFGQNVSIKYGDMLVSSQRESLLNALKIAVPEKVFGRQTADETFAAFKSAKASEGFTELWLNELSAPSKRENLTPLTPGMTLQDNEYTVTRKLGAGGQGTVYLATRQDHISNATQTVALKEFVMPVFPDARVRKSVAEKFQLEAQMLSRIDHPQIVKLFDVFVQDHRAYLVLERITGKTLKRLVQDSGPLPESTVIQYAMEMCELLRYLHAQDPPVIHRDFAPDNLMLSDEKKIFLIDFSVAQQIEVNITGSVVGKHLFMAPEQFRGKASVASDIYSLGATLSYLLTGSDPEAISVSHPRGDNPDVSVELDQLVADCTALDESKRITLDRISERLSSLGATSPPKSAGLNIAVERSTT